jgi:hypothetical protein
MTSGFLLTLLQQKHPSPFPFPLLYRLCTTLSDPWME